MLSNYYILARVARELRRRLVGKVFARAYSVHAGELVIVIGDDTLVTAILNPAHATIYASEVEHAGAPRRNSISFFSELSGLTLTEVEIEHDDKVIVFAFEAYSLRLRFYNSPNAILQQSGTTIASFKKEPEPTPGAATASASPLRSVLPMLGKQLEKEFYLRYPECVGAAEDALRKNATEFDSILRSAEESIIYRRGEDEMLAPIELRSLAGQSPAWSSTAVTGSLSDAIANVLRSRRRSQALADRKRSVRLRLEAIASRTRKAAADAQSGLATSARADRYRAIADAISAAAHDLPKGTPEIEFESNGIAESAPLDPKLTAYENAAKYYDKARRSVQAKADLVKRLDDLTRNEVLVASLIDELTGIRELRELDAFEKNLRARSFLLERSDESAERSGNELNRFRRFRVAGGFEVLAGKNAKQNDELTMKIAAKEDLWFHARHVAGSHVVLRNAGRKDVPREAIEQAASIAAYHSDARTQTVAPVAYTKRKFVRKPKGAAAGAVVVEKEEVIMVEPRESF